MKTEGTIRIRSPRTIDQLLPTDPDGYAAIVGQLTHRVIAETVGLRGVTPDDLVEAAWRLAGAATKGGALGRRARAARLTIAGSAAVYIRCFAPSLDWRLLGSELVLGSGLRVDHGWASPSGVLIDELKTADARSLGRSDERASEQVDAYRELAVARWGERFLGIRLIYLCCANRSQLVLPSGRRVPLAETVFQFGDGPLDHQWA